MNKALKEINDKIQKALKLLATMIGGRQKEGDLHHRFASSRLHGEWFEPSGELLEYIRGIAND